jgi:hypothetical protein
VVKIGFSTARDNPASFLIRRISGSRASHAWLLLRVDPFGQEFAFEASEFGVRLVPWSAFRRQNRIVAVFEPAVPLEPAMPRAGELLGASTTSGPGGDGLRHARRWLKRKWRTPSTAPRRVVLGAGGARAQVGGPPRRGEARARATSPQDLLDLLKALDAKDVTEAEVRRTLAA